MTDRTEPSGIDWSDDLPQFNDWWETTGQYFHGDQMKLLARDAWHTARKLYNPPAKGER